MATGDYSSATRTVTVYGGSGFIGRHVVRALARRGYRIRVAVRRPDLAGHLQPLGGVGQIQAVQANLRDKASVERAAAGTDVLVNLVGILAGSGRQTFDAVHAFGARAVAEAAAGRPVVHLSAIGADPGSASGYARSKAQGEEAVRAASPAAVILRPSVVFGPQDQFFNRFAALARMLPVIPLAGGETKFQPVFVEDVAEAVARAVDGKVAAGTYELGGPQIHTLRRIVEDVLHAIQRRRLVVDLPWGLARVQARVTEIADGLTLGILPDDIVMTSDQVILLQQDNVVSKTAIAEKRTFEGLGIAPSSYEGLIDGYLWRFRKKGQFEPVRTA